MKYMPNILYTTQHTPHITRGGRVYSGLVLLPPSLGSRPGAEEPVPQREALRKVDVGPYVVALVVRRAQLHLQGLEAVSVRDFGPGEHKLRLVSGHARPSAAECAELRRPRGPSLRAAGCGQASARRGVTAAVLAKTKTLPRRRFWACGRHVERAREPRRRPEVAAAVLDARVAVELLKEQVRLADVVPVLAGRTGVWQGSHVHVTM